MADFLFLMHADGGPESHSDWAAYLAGLETAGHLRGGSEIGPGECQRKAGTPAPITPHLSGFVRVAARDIAEARGLLPGNPTYEAGGTVEIRELPVD